MNMVEVIADSPYYIQQLMSCWFAICLLLWQGKGDRVQLEQSDMHLALNMAKMATGGCLHAASMETQSLIKRPCARVRVVKKQGVKFLRRTEMKAAIE
jgi:hypothetical protein